MESPLVTPEGNAVIGLTSLNDDAVGPFDLTIELPPSAAGPFRGEFVATQGSRVLQPIDAVIDSSRLKLRMPSFDTHTAIVALKDAAPLVSLRLKNVERGVAGLATIGLDQAFDVEATVFNPSAGKLGAGELSLGIPAGWLQSSESAKIEAIEPGGQATCTFHLRSLPLAGAKRILPLVAHYQSSSVKSTPATEMVWWGERSSAPAAASDH